MVRWCHIRIVRVTVGHTLVEYECRLPYEENAVDQNADQARSAFMLSQRSCLFDEHIVDEYL